MSKIAFVLAAATAAFALAGASAAAAAAAAIDVPAQVFPDGQAGSHDGAKPVTTSTQRLAASSSDPYPDRGLLAGRSFGVNAPLGAGKRLPLMVHVLSSEEECHDNADVNGDPQRQDQDFIRGGEH